MKDYISSILPRIKEFSLTLDKKEVFIDKPWVWIDENKNQQKFIFKRNGELIMSNNGQVTLGKWEYISGAKSLLIDRIQDKILLNQAFVDEAVMILKRDGMKGDNFMIANELLIPDLDISRYIKELYCKKIDIELWPLDNGEFLEVQHGNLGFTYMGSRVTINIEEVENTSLKTANGAKILLHDSKITAIFKYSNVVLADGKHIIVEYRIDRGLEYEKLPINVGNRVFQEDGETPLPTGKYQIKKLKSFRVENGKITKVGMFI